MNWLDEILESNRLYKKRAAKNLPIERKPCPYAVITCMDPRVDLSAIGINPFNSEGITDSNVRIIRTIGAMADYRSLVIGIHMAGFKEIVVLMHTDCGCSLAFQKNEQIIKNMENSLSQKKFSELKKIVGEPLDEKLPAWLKAFENPYSSIKEEVTNIKKSPFVPDNIIIHGVVLDLGSGKLEIVVNGY